MTQNDEHVNDATEPTGDASPVGFCPYCDYRLVAIGTCPECGNTIDRAAIRETPRRTRRGRMLKRIATVITLVGAILGGRWFIGSPYFYRIWPNTLLIDAYPANLGVTEEVGRRLRAGRFWDDEVRQLVERSFKQEIIIRSPRPARMPLIGTVTVQSVPNSLFVIVPSKMRDHLKPDNCRLGEIELRYTQKSSHISSRRTTTGGGLLLSRQTVEIAYEVAPEIPVGASTLYQELVIHVESSDAQINDAYSALVDYPFTLSASASIVARDQPLSAFIEQEYSPAIEAAWRADVKVWGFRSHKDMATVQICFNQRERPYYVRYNITQRGLDGAGGGGIGGRRKIDVSSASYSTTTSSSFYHSERPIVDVRVVVDLEAAGNDDATVVNPVVMEWHQLDAREFPLLVNDSGGQAAPDSCDRHYAFSPDVVRRMRPEEYEND